MKALRLTRKSLEQMCAQARKEYPAECCGILVLGPEGGAIQVHPCENVQDRLHAEDPQQYPRQARTAYFIDPQEQYRIIAAAEKAGGQVAGFYHSHIDCQAYFSEEDKRRALFGDEPAWPEAAYLVLSVYGEEAGQPQREVKGYRCFAWDSEGGDFAEVGVEVLD
jgi:proteasome lid subunit RPN8/RPN11